MICTCETMQPTEDRPHTVQQRDGVCVMLSFVCVQVVHVKVAHKTAVRLTVKLVILDACGAHRPQNAMPQELLISVHGPRVRVQLCCCGRLYRGGVSDVCPVVTSCLRSVLNMAELPTSEHQRGGLKSRESGLNYPHQTIRRPGRGRLMSQLHG